MSEGLIKNAYGVILPKIQSILPADLYGGVAYKKKQWIKLLLRLILPAGRACKES